MKLREPQGPSSFILHQWKEQKQYSTLLVCAAEVYVNNNNNNNKDMIRYSCCGKVILFNLDRNREITGYVLKETNTHWSVQLTDNRIVTIWCPIYNKDTNNWIFPSFDINRVPHSILEYYLFVFSFQRLVN